MKLLGAIIAGGRSRRFGSDKAAALFHGKPLIEHVADALRRQTDDLVICGRSWRSIESVADWPTADLGPLGGLCGALHHAQAHGFDAVLTAGCDVLPLPDTLAEQLGSGPACVAGQRLLGLWPIHLLPLLDRHLRTSKDRSIRGWIDLCRAREVSIDAEFHNINSVADLDRLVQG